MTNPETIAAFIAARASEPRYKLMPVPGTELCEECPCCGGAHALPNCTTWAAGAGEPLIAGLRAELKQARATIQERAIKDAEDTQRLQGWADRTINDLRAKLDTAYSHIANLEAANIALQYQYTERAETSGYVWQLLDSLLAGTIKVSTGKATIKRAMLKLCPDFKPSR